MQVLAEVHEKYPQYEVFDNPGITDIASKGSIEATDESFEGFFQDVHMLSLTDFVVCTFSSNVSFVTAHLNINISGE